MSIAAVLGYLVGQIDGQTLANGETVEAIPIPMPVLRNGLPEPLRLYIFPNVVSVTMPTMSAGKEWLEEHKPFTMVLRQTVNQASDVAAWPQLVDGLLSLLMKLQVNTPIDANGNVVTVPDRVSFVSVTAAPNQEHMRVNFRYPRMTLDMRPVTLVCEIAVAVREQMAP